MSNLKQLLPLRDRQKGVTPVFSPKGGSCCGQQQSDTQRGGSPCCHPQGEIKRPSVPSPGERRLDIELLYLDLSICSRCQGADASLDEAVGEVARVLEATGVEVVVRKTHVQSEAQARELGFVSSPTIRLNGRDIQWEVKESRCESCCQLSGEDVDCRIWEYQGNLYTVPPKAMIVEAILREVYGRTEAPKPSPEMERDVPDNLKRFWAAAHRRAIGEQRDGTHFTPSVSRGCCG